MLNLMEITPMNIRFYLNLRDQEVVTFYDAKNHIIDTAENLGEIAEKVSTGEAIVLPYVDELYSYNLAMWDFLAENNIVVPDRMSAMEKLRKCGEDQTFREFWHTRLCSKFDRWCSENLI